MALDRPKWLAELSTSFKRHRQQRSGWFVELHGERLRVLSAELPPRPDEPAEAPPKRRSVTLATPPGPATAAAALAECCGLFDAVMAGSWSWPDPDGVPGGDDPMRLSPAVLERLVEKLKAALVGEKIGLDTWHRTYRAYLARLCEVAGQQAWRDDRALLEAVLQSWPPGTRARQMAFDRLRRLWSEASWPWPEGLQTMRGNGKAAADPEGVRAFTDAEIQELRTRLQRSRRLTDADRVAWDCLICFGLRPKELQGLQLVQDDGHPVAHVTRSKRSSKGSSGARRVPAVPPGGWPSDCFDLLDRWHRDGLPRGLLAARSPGEVMAQQLARMKAQKPVEIKLPKEELTPYGLRHAFALRLGQQLGLHVREAAELMGHSPAVHLQTYGRRLDQPGLLAKVRELVAAGNGQSQPVAPRTRAVITRAIHVDNL